MNLKYFLCLLFACFFAKSLAAKDDAVQVLIWDERQPRQSEAYDNFLGNEIATRLAKLDKDLEIRSVAMDDPEQGMTDANLDWADVMIWWGHARQAQVTPETSQKKIVSRIKEGKLKLIFLHSAHWATPFMEAMNERTRIVAKEKFPQPKKGRKIQFQFIALPFRMPPDANSMITPAYYALKRGRQVAQVRVDLPNCCFPGYRPDGKPSTMTVKAPDHPIAKGLPKTFQVNATEMYNEPFHVPEPDEVIFEERWPTGEWFRSGMVWKVGAGKVFYFRPGHETYPVYKQPEMIQVIANACSWLGQE